MRLETAALHDKKLECMALNHGSPLLPFHNQHVIAYYIISSLQALGNACTYLFGSGHQIRIFPEGKDLEISLTY